MFDAVSVWDELEAAGGDGVLLRRARTERPSDVHLAVRMPQRHPMLVVRIDQCPEECDVLFESQGLRSGLDRGPVTGGRAGALTIELLEPQHRDVFGVLVADLVERVRDGLDDEAIVDVLRNRLGRWEQLLRRSRTGLSVEKQRGLYGELLTLNDWLDAGVQPDVAIEAWQGPTGGAHDWELPGLDLEVKARASTKPFVRISSEFQLASRDDNRVVLVVKAIDAVAEGGRSLAQLVDETETRLTEFRSAYVQRLNEYGWFVHHRERYEGTAWDVRDDAAFDASADGFPRLVPAGLPPGVTAVSYNLAVKALSEARMPADAVSEIMKEYVDGI
jgi:hypothetical protein